MAAPLTLAIMVIIAKRVPPTARAFMMSVPPLWYLTLRMTEMKMKVATVSESTMLNEARPSFGAQSYLPSSIFLIADPAQS